MAKSIFLKMWTLLDFLSRFHIPVISFVGNKDSMIYETSTLPIVIGNYDSFSHDLNRPIPFFGEVIMAFETLFFE